MQETAAETRLLNLLFAYNADEQLLDLYYGDFWPPMLHESYEELESPNYPAMGRSNISIHDRKEKIPIHSASPDTPWITMLHEQEPYRYGLRIR